MTQRDDFSTQQGRCLTGERTELDDMADAPVEVTLAGQVYQTEPLGFSAAMLWWKRAGIMEKEANFSKEDFKENGEPANMEVTIRFLDYFPRVLALVFDYFGFNEVTRDNIEKALMRPGRKTDSTKEVITAYRRLYEIANPFRPAPMKMTPARSGPTTKRAARGANSTRR